MGSVSSGNLSTLSPSTEGSLVELYEEVLARGTYEKIGRDADRWGWIPQPQSEISDLECALLVEAIHGLATDAGGFLEKREMHAKTRRVTLSSHIRSLSATKSRTHVLFVMLL